MAFGKVFYFIFLKFLCRAPDGWHSAKFLKFFFKSLPSAMVMALGKAGKRVAAFSSFAECSDYCTRQTDQKQCFFYIPSRQTQIITYISHPSKHTSHIYHIHRIYHIHHNISHTSIQISITYITVIQIYH